jgi:hypothetical protein
MKTLLLTLILSVYSLQSDVKQYKLVTVEFENDSNKARFINGYIAITKDTLYWRQDSVKGSFLVDTTFFDRGWEKTILKKDTIIGRDTLLVYFGVCAVNSQSKVIALGVANPSCGCRLLRKYTYK